MKRGNKQKLTSLAKLSAVSGWSLSVSKLRFLLKTKKTNPISWIL